MISLNLLQRPAEGTNLLLDLEGMFKGWERSKIAIGGYHLGKFSVKNRGIQELTSFYNTWLGCKLIEYTYGIVSYEGILWQLDLVKNGINYRRTLNPRYWHNRVKVNYTDPDGTPSSTSWSANTNSSGIYGEMEYIYSVGFANSTGATADRDRALTEFAWPQSRAVGSITIAEQENNAGEDGLYITVAGMSSTLNWQYRESSSSGAASTLLSTLLGETGFITAGRLETNSMSISVGDAISAQRIGDLIEKIVKHGDSSGNIWKGGVYANQKYIYEQSPTIVDYELQDRQLYYSGILVNPALLNPGFYVIDSNAPRGGQPPGTSNIWNDPQIHYCDEVEYIWPDKLNLKFKDQKKVLTFRL